MTHEIPILVCPKCGGEFDAPSAHAAAIKKGVAWPCNDCIRHVATGLRRVLEEFFGPGSSS